MESYDSEVTKNNIRLFSPITLERIENCANHLSRRVTIELAIVQRRH